MLYHFKAFLKTSLGLEVLALQENPQRASSELLPTITTTTRASAISHLLPKKTTPFTIITLVTTTFATTTRTSANSHLPPKKTSSYTKTTYPTSTVTTTSLISTRTFAISELVSITTLIPSTIFPQHSATSSVAKTTSFESKPKMSNESYYCQEHFDCQETTKLSFTGCYFYYDNGNSECHLFCLLDKCGATFSPHPQMCTFYSCTLKTTTTTSTTTASTTSAATTTIPMPIENPYFWSTLGLSLVLAAMLIFWLGRKCGRMALRRQVRSLRSHLTQLYTELPRSVPSQSPTEETPLTQPIPEPDAWQAQNFEVPEAVAGPSRQLEEIPLSPMGEEDFKFFENKLCRPARFRFPLVDSAMEKFSGVGRSVQLNSALPPYKKFIIANTPDEYKAVADIKHVQIQLNYSIDSLVDFQRSKEFLASEQRAANSCDRAQRISKSVFLFSCKYFLSKHESMAN